MSISYIDRMSISIYIFFNSSIYNILTPSLQPKRKNLFEVSPRLTLRDHANNIDVDYYLITLMSQTGIHLLFVYCIFILNGVCYLAYVCIVIFAATTSAFGHYWLQAASLSLSGDNEFIHTWRIFDDSKEVMTSDVLTTVYENEHPVRAVYVRDDKRAEFAIGIKRSEFKAAQ